MWRVFYRQNKRIDEDISGLPPLNRFSKQTIEDFSEFEGIPPIPQIH
jgi:hypothetical protein